MSDEPAVETPRRQAKPRPSPASRRFGYLISIAVHLVLVYLIYVRPGWRAVPFLTEEAVQVIPLVVLSLLIGVGVNLVWLVVDPLWLRSLGELVTTVVGLVVLNRILTVFPFLFADGSPWETVTRVVLIVGIIGSAIAIVAHIVMVFVHLGRGEPPTAATATSGVG